MNKKCEKTFKHGGAFRRHKLIEHKENEEEVEKEWEALQQNVQWPCELCGKKFLDQHNMKVHKRKEHAVKRNEDLRESLHCVQCDQKFKYGRAFRQHKLIEHGENEAEVEKEWKTLQQNWEVLELMFPISMFQFSLLLYFICKCYMYI